jgi:sodium transport system permease protein
VTFSATKAIFFKEFKDILRDRRTVISAVLLPILITPLMMVGIGGFAERQIAAIKEKPTNIGWIGSSDGAGTKPILSAIPNVKISDLENDTTIAFEVLRSKGFDVVVVIPEDFDLKFAAVTANLDSIAPKIGIYSDKTREKSGFSATLVIGAIEQARLQKVEEILKGYGLKQVAVRPFEFQRFNVADEEKSAKSGLASILPYLLIIMVLSGAIYPAIDMTAGEKERGTLETLLVSAVSRTDIVMGKFLTVFSIALITAALQLISMAITFQNAATIAPAMVSEMPFRLTVQDILLLTLTIIPLAIMFSASLMVIAIFAKSYREAQTYVAPIMFIVIFASMMSLFPSEPSHIMSIIPVMNVSLLLKQALVGQMEVLSLVLTMCSNLVVAVISLYLVFLMFRKESVLFRI